MEIKIDAIRMEIVKRRIGFKGCITINSLGSRGGLALLWKSGDQVNIENYSQHHISAWVTDPTIGSKWLFSSFYGELETSRRNKS